ncbi:MAG TPA: hypothetical protein DDY16_01710 [Tenacibaculum sp.]|nr:hypothetical protein [Tenacibaculum sp.]
MTQDQEKEVLKALYDRIFDVITYQPAGGENPFTESETFIHFSKNSAVNPKSFLNPRTPSNPTGDIKASEEFSRMVDMVSPLSLEWQNSGDRLSEKYSNIVNSANVTTEQDEKQVEMYKKAYDYLRPEKTEKNPFTDEEITSRSDSKEYIEYEANMEEYVSAISMYRGAYNLYLDDLESKDPEVSSKADRNWQAKAPMLENEIKKAFRKLASGNAKFVKQALDILNTTINDGIRTAISVAKESIQEDRKFSSSLGFDNKWLLSYPSPSNWNEEGALNFTEFKLSGGNTNIRSKSTEHKFGLDVNVNYGLWNVKTGVGGEFKNSNSSTDKDSLEITAKFAKVDIKRPWFSESLFRLGSWSTELVKKHGISNGQIDSSNKGNYLPMYPVSFIVAKDISIKADFSHEEEEHISQSVNGSASVGYGPFSVGGNYGFGSTEDNFSSDYQNGEIRVPGLQIIGWVSRVIPASPQEG